MKRTYLDFRRKEVSSYRCVPVNAAVGSDRWISSWPKRDDFSSDDLNENEEEIDYEKSFYAEHLQPVLVDAAGKSLGRHIGAAKRYSHIRDIGEQNVHHD
jgi:hypothetical protein